jgi:hypothetical protein
MVNLDLHHTHESVTAAGWCRDLPKPQWWRRANPAGGYTIMTRMPEIKVRGHRWHRDGDEPPAADGTPRRRYSCDCGVPEGVSAIERELENLKLAERTGRDVHQAHLRDFLGELPVT